ncbi:MAG TPA: hypothetical protein VD995_34180 [Azospirillum sp.]|nr:hypothetical protein [Azospirillum sp.]
MSGEKPLFEFSLGQSLGNAFGGFAVKLAVVGLLFALLNWGYHGLKQSVGEMLGLLEPETAQAPARSDLCWFGRCTPSPGAAMKQEGGVSTVDYVPRRMEAPPPPGPAVAPAPSMPLPAPAKE